VKDLLGATVPTGLEVEKLPSGIVALALNAVPFFRLAILSSASL